ncbi:MAG: hypothetical protein JSU70_01840 [Phycisphaerales bacterium]|nr:MAG: hypothetical protein JSU70_01840 [Phycisphaerales bacterium]
MNQRDQTDMGGLRDTFLTTHWSQIGDIQAGADEDRALISLLLERYWRPVYSYLRRRGFDNERAKDLTQGFFHEVVLNRRLVERAEPSKGRFRTLLLHALNQYVIDEQRKETAQKRIPPDKLVRLDLADLPAWAEPAPDLDADQSFNYSWKADLLDRVLAELKDRYVKRGMELHWYIFRDRIANPILEDFEPPSLTDICEQYGIENEVTASNMLKTVKRLFQSTLRKYVRQTVVSGELVEEEMQEIFQFFEKKRTE